MDSDSIHWPDALPLPMESIEDASNPRLETTVMDSGRMRVRRGAASLWSVYDAKWNFIGDEFETFLNFFDNVLAYGSLPFVMPIYGTDTELRFLEGKYNVAHSEGLYSVTARICTV